MFQTLTIHIFFHTYPFINDKTIVQVIRNEKDSKIELKGKENYELNYENHEIPKEKSFKKVFFIFEKILQKLS